jgi:hypothetical protein
LGSHNFLQQWRVGSGMPDVSTLPPYVQSCDVLELGVWPARA